MPPARSAQPLPPGDPSSRSIALEMGAQPDDTTCGPTCLQALYRYYGDDVPVEQIVREVEPLEGGGTMAVRLACHALRRGYEAEIFTYNLQVFDPTWFQGEVDLVEKLRAQHRRKRGTKLGWATDAYCEYHELGGRMRYEELTPELLYRFLDRGIPVLTGLNATYLYNCARELHDDFDDVGGRSAGHFVIVRGYDHARHEALIADPLHENPGFGTHDYSVGMHHLICSILLGIVTYDANLAVITPRTGAPPSS